MFEYRSDLTQVPFTLESVLELYGSVNEPQIAAEANESQAAKAFFCSGRGAEGVEAYIYLHMLVSHVALVYRWGQIVGKSDYPDVQTAAIEFTESMGFMMEDFQVRRLEPGERDQLFASVPCFKPLAAAASPKASAVASPQVSLEDDLLILEAAEDARDSILELPVPDVQTTQAGFVVEGPSPEPTSDPLEDKNFKVFLRLLTSA